MKARRSSKFVQIGPPTTELGVLERLKISPYTYNGKNGVATFYRTVFILTGNDDIHKNFDEF